MSAEVEDLRVALQIAEFDRDAAELRVDEMRELAEDLVTSLESLSATFCEFRLTHVHCALLHAERFGVHVRRDEFVDEPDDESEEIDERDIPFLWRPDEPAMGQETDHNPFA